MENKENGSETRVFVYVDMLEDGTLLFRTEYGSLIPEKWLVGQVRGQIKRAMRYLDFPHEHQKLTVVVTVDAMDTPAENGEEAQKE